MKIERFEDLECGKEARKLVNMVQFLFISKSSASEVQSIFYVALDQAYVDRVSFDRVYHQAEKVAKLDSGLITYLLETERKNKKTNPNNSINPITQRTPVTQ